MPATRFYQPETFGPGEQSREGIESADLFSLIVEGLTKAVWLMSADGGQVLFVNAAYEKIWGQPRAELYADPLAFLGGVHPDDRERVRAGMTSVPDTNRDAEFRVVRPTGEMCWVESRVFPVRDDDGRLLRIGVVVQDITERRRIVESHERLVRGFTHDIKNPLGAADGFMALLELGIHGELSAPQQDFVRRARAAIRSAVGLVVQLLAIERAQSDQLAVDRAHSDIDRLSSDTVAQFASAAEGRNIELSMLPSRAEDSLVSYTDPALVQRILANLISNAVKYTQPGGHVTVRAHIADEHQALWPGRWIAVEVADDGPGIPLAKQSLLFREFTRFDPAAAEGSGLGLAISQRLAFALGATISCESTVGVGSTFTLWLPETPPRLGS